MHDIDIHASNPGLSGGLYRVKVTVECLDGTEVYFLYPLGSRTIEWGESIHIDHEIGFTLTS
jgi:hypothetical protein